MRKASLLFALISLVAASGCKQQQSVIGGKNRTSTAHTVISLSPSTTELDVTYGGTFKLIGRTASCDYPPTVKSIDVVAGVKPDFEKIVAMRPGVITYDGSLYSPSDIDQLKQGNPGTELVKIDGDTIDQFTSNLFELGKALHSESQVSEYVDNILAARATAIGDPMPSNLKVAVLLPGPNGLGMVAGVGSFQADTLKAAGATPIGPTGDKFVEVNPEGFLEMNPDMIVLAASKESAEKAYKALMDDPKLKSVKAIQNKKILIMDQDVVLRRGGRVDRLIDTLHRRLKALV